MLKFYEKELLQLQSHHYGAFPLLFAYLPFSTKRFLGHTENVLGAEKLTEKGLTDKLPTEENLMPDVTGKKCEGVRD